MTRRWALPLLFLAFLLFYLAPLATKGLWIPDEARYAQIGQEILLRGHWAAPHFMELRYFEKPIAGYWMIALGQALFGHNLFGVRFASALSTGLSVLLVYLLAARLWNDPRKSFAAAILFMSFGLIAGQAGYANLDPQFTFWVNLSFIALWLAIDSTTKKARLLSWAALGFACSWGFMTKGFLALLLPVLIALPYMIWRKRFGELLGYGLVAVFVAALVSLPWVIAVHLQEPDYWRFFFWHEHIRRFAAEDAQHGRPWWFYLPLMVISSLPWAAYLPATLKDAWKSRGQQISVFLLLWLLLPLAFFSLSRGKLPTYIMPCLMPLALLMGHSLMERIARAEASVPRLNSLLNLVLGLLAAAALVFFQLKKPFYHDEPVHLTLLCLMIAGWILLNVISLFRPLKYWALPALGMGLLVALVPTAMPSIVVHNKMPDQFIAEHSLELSKSHRLLSNDLGAASALAWRLKRTDITLYNTRGELKYGLGYPEATERTRDMTQIQAWMDDARREGQVGVVMRLKGAEEQREIAMLPKDYTRYEDGNIVILIFPQSAS
ncbi:4-amino-4-deoxy-L-arabinose lipid A transferase [Pseudomonas agarici]|uniref:Undecaprenyl phosphate-alpha-4-amino-4-deoxy-L-arabinose arabinosyl transferase n=1 Tax=Pseudomonas agarici TaxID=46677 RepID=A0A0X1SYE7_PSEAA|nr:lipid IV(A) 4-amino-4-deoxy-L-arabinosyltransferase [Pseudomonas agarici]AMB84866.1 4-amino-4-deoxy-L-arabinose lipid A transferase [Pseudomonas agarici]NWC08525.1 lipid IV(A) 4-amino-4-deoxy-L-arabinosyltransferase [Pseudomonas agarici]SEK69829.1 4-amino-4-deoxy-L-arabinose transferase [Pseudomonas agarici]